MQVCECVYVCKSQHVCTVCDCVLCEIVAACIRVCMCVDGCVGNDRTCSHQARLVAGAAVQTSLRQDILEK